MPEPVTWSTVTSNSRFVAPSAIPISYQSRLGVESASKMPGLTLKTSSSKTSSKRSVLSANEVAVKLETFGLVLSTT